MDALAAKEEAVAKYYERHKTEYAQPERRRFVRLEFPGSDAGLLRAHNVLEGLRNRPLVTPEVDRLIRKHAGGWVGYEEPQGIEQRFGADVRQAVAGLGTGQWHPEALRSDDKWVLVHLISVQDAVVRRLEDVDAEIREKLLRARRTEDFDRFLAEIRRAHPVAVYEERLEALQERHKAR